MVILNVFEYLQLIRVVFAQTLKNNAFSYGYKLIYFDERNGKLHKNF